MAFTPGLKASYSAQIAKTRELPLVGRTLVKVGDTVKSTDEVLSADLPGNLHILRISEKLGIDPDEVLDAIQKNNVSIGKKVKQGETILEHSGLFGLFKSRFESPCDGVIEYISKTSGHVGVRESSSPLTITAYIPGKVINISEGKSVTIESQGAIIQGIFGVGGEKIGILHDLNITDNKAITEADIPSECSNKILFGGTSPSIEIINEAAKRGAVGLIVGAIDDQALTEYLGYDLGVAITGDEDVPMTLIVTEGFGNLVISNRVLSLLKKFNGKSGSINGATQVRAGAVRPEIIVIHSNEDKAVIEKDKSQSLELGSQIRVIRVPYFGAYGQVVELPNELTLIETGAKARVLKAKLNDGRLVTVPRANVELV